MSGALKILLVAEGPSEYGELDRLASASDGRRKRRRAQGFFPPMLRKMLGCELDIDAQRVMSLPRFERKPRIPGHGERAAKALAIAASQGYELLVFVKDVDREGGVRSSPLERRKKLAGMHSDIETGFAAVEDSEHVSRVKATPCRMIEAWALGDSKAVELVRGRRASNVDVPRRPEELWGDHHDPTSNHPSCVLSRVLGEEPNAHTFESLADAAEPSALRSSCPESFKRFEDELTHAAATLLRPHKTAKLRNGRPWPIRVSNRS